MKSVIFAAFALAALALPVHAADKPAQAGIPAAATTKTPEECKKAMEDPKCDQACKDKLVAEGCKAS